MNSKILTILHSNDMHGDFQAEKISENTSKEGGVSLLSGYINSVRFQDKNVLYFIAGDMIQGSLIDSEFQSLSTIELMNYLSPDVVTLGNHELDHGLAHFLFLEKLANFPIINANIYIEKYNKRLLNSHIILRKDGLNILVIGIVTIEALERINKNERIAPLISIRDYCEEIGKVCNSYKTDDIDLTVILSHIGLEEDKILAAKLNPDWGVDIIIGGHSHSILKAPEIINGVLITQAGKGTDQIGRFDIEIDKKSNRIINYTWRLIPITNKVIDPDVNLQKFVDTFQQQVDNKYNTLVCKLSNPISHYRREAETPLGNLFADILNIRGQSDITFVGSNSIRRRSLGPAVTLGDIKTIYPYDDKLIRTPLKGKQIHSMINYFLRHENRHPDGDFYQVNRSVKAKFNLQKNQLISLLINGENIIMDKTYLVCLEEFHYKNMEKKFNFCEEDLTILNPCVISSSCRDVIINFLSANQNITSEVDGRLQDFN